MPSPPPTLYEWAGGEPAFRALFTRFYQRVPQHPVLAPIFAQIGVGLGRGQRALPPRDGLNAHPQPCSANPLRSSNGADGWYYDDPTAPSRIITCPQTCSRIKGGGSVRVVLHCPTLEQ